MQYEWKEKYKALQYFFFKKKRRLYVNQLFLALAVTIIKYGRYYFDHLTATSSREKRIPQKEQ